jgi:hypothetical protein
MIPIAQLFATQFANPLNATLVVLNLKTQFAMSNVKNQNAKLNAQIKDAKCSIAQNVLLSAKLLTVLLIAKHPNLSAKPYVKSQNVTGNAINQLAQNQNAS